jgi:hypothetical protein
VSPKEGILVFGFFWTGEGDGIRKEQCKKLYIKEVKIYFFYY